MVLLQSTETYIQYPVINHIGKEYEKEYVCITESLCSTAVINTTLQINYASIKNKIGKAAGFIFNTDEKS